MATNYPGPYEVRVFYNVYNGATTEQHVHRVNVRVNGTPVAGSPMSSISFLDRDGTLVQADTAILAWANLIKVRWAVHANNVISHAELWRYAAQSFDATFIATQSLLVATTGGGTTAIAGQEIYVFRTAEGGIMKMSFMETVQPPGVPISYAGLAAPTKAIIDNVLNLTDSLWVGRDTSYPVAFTLFFPGQNEALFKKRFGRN